VTFDIQQVFTSPQLLNLQDDQVVVFPLKVEGYTKPYATVEIKYNYQASLFGSPVMLQGLAATKKLSADEKGYFSDVYKSSWGTGTKHTITVTAIDKDGNRSPETVVNLLQQ
jgi:hypothetical protein